MGFIALFIHSSDTRNILLNLNQLPMDKSKYTVFKSVPHHNSNYGHVAGVYRFHNLQDALFIHVLYEPIKIIQLHQCLNNFITPIYKNNTVTYLSSLRSPDP